MNGSADPLALQALLAGTRPPRSPPRASSREGRVALVGEAAEALLAGRLPSGEARMFVAGALLAWLEDGGALEDRLRVNQRGSHETPQRIWARRRLIADEGRAETLAADSGASSSTEDHPE